MYVWHSQKLYCDLLDTVDGERSGELLELSSSLRGLKRTVYLTSQTQLNNLVRPRGRGRERVVRPRGRGGESVVRPRGRGRECVVRPRGRGRESVW